MIKTGWKYYLVQVVCWLLVVQMINISIDPPDIKIHLQSSSRLKQEKKVNQIECIYELVSENLWDTAIPEDDESEIEKTINPLVLYCSNPPLQSFEVKLPLLQHQSHYATSFTLLYGEPPFQPPKNA